LFKAFFLGLRLTEIIQELRSRLHAGHEEEIASSSACHVEKVALCVVDLFEVRRVSHVFDSCL
jgi:hypothetical protein